MEKHGLMSGNMWVGHLYVLIKLICVKVVGAHTSVIIGWSVGSTIDLVEQKMGIFLEESKVGLGEYRDNLGTVYS